MQGVVGVKGSGGGKDSCDIRIQKVGRFYPVYGDSVGGAVPVYGDGLPGAAQGTVGALVWLREEGLTASTRMNTCEQSARSWLTKVFPGEG
ncbi:hypothetical protein E2C01_054946 [Portunus trituberculatus]|uniref:Uncharacterized protein n=1 Tax=Portunus trituberculatus TaxID=210409 RepID=A0A5B7GTJ3_PORTR|nr:hypothetical protein [Portunus trituberculatus]